MPSLSVWLLAFIFLVEIDTATAAFLRNTRLTTQTDPEAKGSHNVHLTCPHGSIQVGEINSGVSGCGLSCGDDEERSDRFNSSRSISECLQSCESYPNGICKSFTWSPVGGNSNHMKETVCTLYQTNVKNETQGPNQIMCERNPPRTEEEKYVMYMDEKLEKEEIENEKMDRHLGSFDQPPVSDYKIWLDGQSWSGSKWLDKSTNGHHSDNAHGTINTAVEVNSDMTYLHGDINSGVTLISGWPSGSSEYTFFHLSKLNGVNKERIWTGTTGNWLSGHDNGLRGLFHHGGYNSNDEKSVGNVDSWGVFTDRINSSGSNVRVDSIDVTTNPDPKYIPDAIAINPEDIRTTEHSDWAAGMVLVYDRYLSDSEVNSVEEWICAQYIQTSTSCGSPNTVAFVDFSQGDDCPTCTPYSLHNAQIQTAPGGEKALRISSDGPYAKISGINIGPTSMPYCTLTIGVYLESITDGNLAWIFGHEEQTYDRGIILYDARFSEGGEDDGQSVIGSGTGQNWLPWANEESGIPPTKEWFHVTAVFRQDGECAVYVNGVKSDYTTIGQNNEGKPDLYVGRPLDRNDHWADAWIKEVKVLNGALSDDHVQYESDIFFGIVTRTDTVGGSGGILFDDKHTPWLYGKIVQIEVNYGNWFDYIKITYDNGQSFSHGRIVTTSTEIITLCESQYIVKVSGREVNDKESNGISQLTFETNDGVIYGPYGYKPNNGETFEFDFDGNALLHIFGLTDSFGKVYQIGFAHTIREFPPSPSSLPCFDVDLYEAEDPSNELFESLVENNHVGFTGSGYADMGGQGSWIEWPDIDGSSGGPCTLKFRYAVANPSTTYTRPCQIQVNNFDVGTVTFPAFSESWSDYGSDSIEIMCPEGSFKVRMTATTSNGGPNVDYLQVLQPIPYSLSPSSIPSMVPSVQTSEQPSSKPSGSLSSMPSLMLSSSPSSVTSMAPSVQTSEQPSSKPSGSLSSKPSLMLSSSPSSIPSMAPSVQTSKQPSNTPSLTPSSLSSIKHSNEPSSMESLSPSTLPLQTETTHRVYKDASIEIETSSREESQVADTVQHTLTKVIQDFLEQDEENYQDEHVQGSTAIEVIDTQCTGIFCSVLFTIFSEVKCPDGICNDENMLSMQESFSTWTGDKIYDVTVGDEADYYLTIFKTYANDMGYNSLEDVQSIQPTSGFIDIQEEGCGGDSAFVVWLSYWFENLVLNPPNPLPSPIPGCDGGFGGWLSHVFENIIPDLPQNEDCGCCCGCGFGGWLSYVFDNIIPNPSEPVPTPSPIVEEGEQEEDEDCCCGCGFGGWLSHVFNNIIPNPSEPVPTPSPIVEEGEQEEDEDCCCGCGFGGWLSHVFENIIPNPSEPVPTPSPIVEEGEQEEDEDCCCGCGFGGWLSHVFEALNITDIPNPLPTSPTPAPGPIMEESECCGDDFDGWLSFWFGRK